MNAETPSLQRFRAPGKVLEVAEEKTSADIKPEPSDKKQNPRTSDRPRHSVRPVDG